MLSDYVPDPLEIIEAQAERMIEKHFPARLPDIFRCAVCDQLVHQSVGFEALSSHPASSHPAAPPVCMPCIEKIEAAKPKGFTT